MGWDPGLNKKRNGAEHQCDGQVFFFVVVKLTQAGVTLGENASARVACRTFS